jgi:hypothetical protein
MEATFQQRYLSLVSEIEKRFRVAQWKSGDLDIWPIARMDLFLDMHWNHTGQEPTPRASILKRLWIFSSLLTLPVSNAWKSRHDLKHRIIRPHAAYAILLGDGVSLDLVNGAWQDRFGEPIIAELERSGLETFVMQPGDLSRLPWRRPTFAANLVDVGSGIASRLWRVAPDLPDLDGVISYLREQNIAAPSLERVALSRRAARVSIAAGLFSSILKIVRPRIAFVVTYYAGLGPAFLLACRRCKILSVDLQHCPQEGAHKAYGWSNVPAKGYNTLPAVFWSWNLYDADYVGRWTKTLAAPWHRSIHGGNTQVAALCAQPTPPQIVDKIFTREILVALQPIAGQIDIWNALATVIESAPRHWRWWIRRHPSSRTYQDSAFGRLLTLRGDNIVIDAASTLPLPVLLPRMTVLVSLMSGAAGEAAMFGVPAVFLSDEAAGTFGSLIERACARVVDVAQLAMVIEALHGQAPKPSHLEQPALPEVLHLLDGIADDYQGLIAPYRAA